MKNSLALALVLLTGNLVSLALIAIAAYLIHLDRPNWGWVLFAALCAHVAPTGKYKGPQQPEPEA